MTRYAAIDVGTNTIRLLVADAQDTATYRPIFQEQVITRLGERLQETGVLGAGAVERALASGGVIDERMVSVIGVLPKPFKMRAGQQHIAD